MTQRSQVYKCSMCGNMVEMLHPGAGELVCCAMQMELFSANTVDAAKEKHVPLVEKTLDGFKVTVGSVPHPMDDKHYIEWVELIVGDKLYRQFLNPGEPPEVVFCVTAPTALARAYCNLHGLWGA